MTSLPQCKPSNGHVLKGLLCIFFFFGSNQTTWRKSNLASKLSIDNMEKQALLNGADSGARQRWGDSVSLSANASESGFSWSTLKLVQRHRNPFHRLSSSLLLVNTKFLAQQLMDFKWVLFEVLFQQSYLSYWCRNKFGTPSREKITVKQNDWPLRTCDVGFVYMHVKMAEQSNVFCCCFFLVIHCHINGKKWTVV